jgi:hypothetical protein
MQLIVALVAGLAVWVGLKLFASPRPKASSAPPTFYVKPPFGQSGAAASTPGPGSGLVPWSIIDPQTGQWITVYGSPNAPPPPPPGNGPGVPNYPGEAIGYTPGDTTQSRSGAGHF